MTENYQDIPAIERKAICKVCGEEFIKQAESETMCGECEVDMVRAEDDIVEDDSIN